MTDFRFLLKEPYVVTTTIRAAPCEHLNGWYVRVRFWLFSKRVYVCSDCGKAIDPKKMRDAADRREG